jgi:hypothetical protein
MWILLCSNCQVEFQHSQISDVGMSYLMVPEKPAIPVGQKCVCPSCDSEEHINERICDIGRIAKAWAIGRNFNYSFDRVERLGFASKFH